MEIRSLEGIVLAHTYPRSRSAVLKETCLRMWQRISLAERKKRTSGTCTSSSELMVRDKKRKLQAHSFVRARATASGKDSAFNAQRKIKLPSDIVYRYLNRPTATSTDSLISPPPTATSPEVRSEERKRRALIDFTVPREIAFVRQGRTGGGHRGGIFATCSVGGGRGAEFSITPSAVDPYHGGAYSTDSGASGPPFAK